MYGGGGVGRDGTEGFVPVSVGGDGGGVITEQPLQSYGGSQVSGGGLLPATFGRLSHPHLPQMMSAGGTGGVPLPGFEILDRVPAFKIHTTGKLIAELTAKRTNCQKHQVDPSYAVTSIK
jgi:hypothetical protein